MLSLSFAVTAFSQPVGKIRIINNNPGEEGFNDPTPAAPVGGNPGTTVGEQRLIALQYAADLWSALIGSPVEIRVQAVFEPLDCSNTSFVLGSAAPVSVYEGFPNAPFPEMWYVSALASRLSGMDLDEGDPAIRASFNSALGQPGCGGGTTWYYGLDNNAGENQIDLVVVVLHELGHGLGFTTTTSKSSGQLLGGRLDVYSNFLYDNGLGLSWPQMSDAQRAQSARANGSLAWSGTNVTSSAEDLLSPASMLEITSPETLRGRYRVGLANFGGEITVAGVTASITAALDEANREGPSETDGCTSLRNSAAIAGRIALIDRGECTFASKSKRAQDAGAIAVIIANHVPGAPAPGMTGNDPSITIPVVSISDSDARAIRAQLATGVTATIRLDPQRLAGTDDSGRLLLHAPENLEGGSSVSHWDRSAAPNLLMEPTISPDLGHGVDLTRDLFADIGWYARSFVHATLEASLLVDHNNDSRVDRGDVLRVSVNIRNNSLVAAQTVTFHAAIAGKAILVPGSVTGGNPISGDQNLTIELGSLPSSEHRTLTFDLVVSPALPTTTSSLSLQGELSGANLIMSVTDDPRTADAADPTIIELSHHPLRAFKTVALGVDADGSRTLSTGDSLRYDVEITNHSQSTVTGVVFEDTVDVNTTIVPESVTTDSGSISSGHRPGDRTIRVDIGVIAQGASVRIRYDVIVNDDIPSTSRSIENQGVITAADLDPLLTDDPATESQPDATIIRLAQTRRRGVRR